MADAMSLRRARADDASAIAAIYAPYVRDTAISFEADPPDAAAMAARIATIADASLPWIVATDGAGRVQGYAYAGRFHARHAYRFTVEPAVYVAQDARGCGVGAQLYTALFGILAELGYRQAIALVTLPNNPSVTLHEQFGFRQIGRQAAAGYKFGDWIDVGMFQKALGDEDASLPEEPRALKRSAIWKGLA